MKVRSTPAPIDPSGWTYDLKCGDCESELTVEWNDLKVQAAYDDGPHHHSPAHAYCRCAVCGNDISVKEEWIPKAYHRKLGI